MNQYIKGAEHRWNEVPKLIGEGNMRMWQPNVDTKGLRDYKQIHFEYKPPTWQELELIERKFQTTKTRAQIHLNTLTQRLGPIGMTMRAENKGRPEGFGPQAPPSRGPWWNRLVSQQERHAETAQPGFRASSSRQPLISLRRSSTANPGTRPMHSGYGRTGWR